MTERILDVDDVKRAGVTLAVDDGANTPQVTTSSNHAEISRVKLDEIHNFPCGNFQLYCVVDLDQRIRVAESTSIMGS